MRREIIKRVDMGSPIRPDALEDVLFYGDEYAHRIIAEVWKNGQKADLTGAGVQGYVVRSDGTTVVLTDTGVTTDEAGDTCRAYIDLLPDCYAVEGRVGIFLKVTGTDTITTTLALWGSVASCYTENLVIVTDELPDISDLLAEIDAMAAAAAAVDVDKEQTLCAASIQNAQHVKMDDAMSIFPHQYYYLNASGEIKLSSSTSVDVRTTQKLVAVPGDTISITLSEAATSGRLVFAVIGTDGTLTHSAAAAGQDTMVTDTYTFGTGDAYFRLSGRYGKRASFSVTYTPAARE